MQIIWKDYLNIIYNIIIQYYYITIVYIYDIMLSIVYIIYGKGFILRKLSVTLHCSENTKDEIIKAVPIQT